MKIHELPFGKFIELNDAFVEVIIYEGVELTSDMIHQFQYYLKNRNSDRNGVLINKINDYTFTFNAQLQLNELPPLDAIAVITYSQISRQITESMIRMQRKVSWNVEFFDNRRTAIEWLRTQLDIEKPHSARSIL